MDRLMNRAAVALAAVLCATVVVRGQSEKKAYPIDDYLESRGYDMNTAPPHGDYRPPVLGMPWLKDLDGPLDVYPNKAAGKADSSFKATRIERTTELVELEPNDTTAQTQFISISSAIDAEVDVELTGSISPGDDVDYFRFTAKKGDFIGIAVVATDDDGLSFTLPKLNPEVRVTEISGEEIAGSDDGIEELTGADLIPPESPFPLGQNPFDASFVWAAPSAGDYLIQVRSFASASSGEYTLVVRPRRPSFESEPIGEQQTIFLDFDGALNLNAFGLYGQGLYAADLSPLSELLWAWGLDRADEAAVVQAIIDAFERKFEALRTPALAGDRDLDGVDGSFDYQLLNSRDHADPWGQPNVSRILICGTNSEIGFDLPNATPVLGISQWLDDGNFSHDDTVVVLIDFLSDTGFLVDPYDDIKNVPLAPGVSIIDAIGEVVGNIAAHELGHSLGLWHTDNTNDINCIIDTGGNGILDDAGVGPDGIFGTADDDPAAFIPDMYEPPNALMYEFFGLSAALVGLENVDVRTAFALTTGTRFVTPEPPTPPTPATASIRAMPTTGAAPLQVSFAGGGLDPDGDPFVTFNWNFGDGKTGSGVNVEHIYTTPGTYMATLTAWSADGEMATATVRVNVIQAQNKPPVPSISATPNSGEAPLIVLFEASATDTDGVVVRYEWDFGDGTTGEGQTTEHVYLDAGAYGVVLTAVDDMGGRGVTTAIIRATASQTTRGDQDTDGSTGTPAGGSQDSEIPLTVPNCGGGVAGAMAASALALVGLLGMRRRYRF